MIMIPQTNALSLCWWFAACGDMAARAGEVPLDQEEPVHLGRAPQPGRHRPVRVRETKPHPRWGRQRRPGDVFLLVAVVVTLVSA